MFLGVFCHAEFKSVTYFNAAVTVKELCDVQFREVTSHNGVVGE